MLTTFLIEIEIQEDVLKKNEVYNGIVTRLHFPNKGYVQVEGEEKAVMVKKHFAGPDRFIPVPEGKKEKRRASFRSVKTGGK